MVYYSQGYPGIIFARKKERAFWKSTIGSGVGMAFISDHRV
jgi:hypothetical protein